jgi:hypothetical protein
MSMLAYFDRDETPRYFVMTKTAAGQTTYQVWDRQQGVPAMAKTYSRRQAAITKADRLNAGGR